MKMLEASYPGVGRVFVLIPEWRDRISLQKARRREHIVFMVWGDDYNTDQCWEIPRLRWPQFEKLINDLDPMDTEESARRLTAYASLVGKEVQIHAHGSAE